MTVLISKFYYKNTFTVARLLQNNINKKSCQGLHHAFVSFGKNTKTELYAYTKWKREDELGKHCFKKFKYSSKQERERERESHFGLIVSVLPVYYFWEKQHWILLHTTIMMLMTDDQRAILILICWANCFSNFVLIMFIFLFIFLFFHLSVFAWHCTVISLQLFWFEALGGFQFVDNNYIDFGIKHCFGVALFWFNHRHIHITVYVFIFYSCFDLKYENDDQNCYTKLIFYMNECFCIGFWAIESSTFHWDDNIHNWFKCRRKCNTYFQFPVKVSQLLHEKYEEHFP